MIRLEHVSMSFSAAKAVDDVSLDIAGGESVALWGSNGAGKSTLIRCVLGLLRYRGRVRVAGYDVRRCGKFARLHVGYVPQEIGFYDDLRVGEAIDLFGRLKGIRDAKPARVLGGVGLEGQDGKQVRELSGGMKQRLALAIALLGDPPVLVLDEVTASLDALGRRELLTMLRQLSASGRTLLFASHRVDEVSALATRVAVMDRGKLVRTEPSGVFVESLGQEAMLHLSIGQGSRERAMGVLLERGFVPRLNGSGLLVPVRGENKAVPFRVLAEAEITIDDFDVVAAGENTPVCAVQTKEGHP